MCGAAAVAQCHSGQHLAALCHLGKVVETGHPLLTENRTKQNNKQAIKQKLLFLSSVNKQTKKKTATTKQMNKQEQMAGKSCLLPGKFLEELSMEAISMCMKDMKMAGNS